MNRKLIPTLFSFRVLKNLLFNFYPLEKTTPDDGDTSVRLSRNTKAKSNDNDQEIPFPYQGRIIKKEKMVVFGIIIAYKRKLCTVSNDGIISPTDNFFGWVDIFGLIHKEITRNPNSDFIDEIIIGRIVNKEVYLENIKIGYLD